MDIIQDVMNNDQLTEFEKIEKVSKHLRKISENDYKIFVKALFMCLRSVEDEDTLKQMYDVYDCLDISLLHDEITRQI